MYHFEFRANDHILRILEVVEEVTLSQHSFVPRDLINSELKQFLT